MNSECRVEERKLCNRLEAVFPAISQNEGLARAVAAAFAAQADPTVEELTEIRTALSEAVSNAVIYGYPQGEGQVRLELSLYSDGRFVMVVEDQGVGIPDVERAREPLFTTGDAQHGIYSDGELYRPAGCGFRPGKGNPHYHGKAAGPEL